MRYIDLRSDTVTQPTEEMRRAMACAPVGDDVYGDDPTVNRLQELAAERMGKEAALFVPSGTMGNELAVMTHTRRSQEIILSDESHIAVHEGGAAATLAAVMLRELHFPDGLPVPEQIERAIRDPDNIHFPRTGMVELENPLATGKVVPLDTLRRAYEAAHRHNVPVHLDGARIFNAAAALGVDAKEIAQYGDSVMFCLSKGLCAPVGSMLCGTKEFIAEALRNRKMLGGGMRQAGILAAAGIIAIETMSQRLKEDHENARYLARRLLELPGVSLDLSSVEINMVFFHVDRPRSWLEALPTRMLEHGVKIGGWEDGSFRFVTSNDVTREDLDLVVGLLDRLLRSDA